MCTIQIIADNVDHNVQTLDGHCTFYGMGMVAAITSAHSTPIVVPLQNVATKYILESGHIAIHQYNYPRNTSTAIFNDLVELRFKIKVLTHLPLTSTLWKVSPCLKWPRPGWSELMQMVQNGNHPGKESVVFLSMLNLDPTDMSWYFILLWSLTNHYRGNHRSSWWTKKTKVILS